MKSGFRLAILLPVVAVTLCNCPLDTGGGAGDDANLKSLATSSGTLNSAFPSGTTSSAVIAQNSACSVFVVPAANNAGVDTTVNGAPCGSGATTSDTPLVCLPRTEYDHQSGDLPGWPRDEKYTIDVARKSLPLPQPPAFLSMVGGAGKLIISAFFMALPHFRMPIPPATTAAANRGVAGVHGTSAAAICHVQLTELPIPSYLSYDRHLIAVSYIATIFSGGTSA